MVSRIQVGKLALHSDQTDIVGLVREVVEVQREAEPGRTIHLQLPDGPSPVVVEADAGRIEQMVTNFLTNACKYSPADRPVEVGVEVAGEQMRAGCVTRVWQFPWTSGSTSGNASTGRTACRCRVARGEGFDWDSTSRA